MSVGNVYLYNNQVMPILVMLFAYTGDVVCLYW